MEKYWIIGCGDIGCRVSTQLQKKHQEKTLEINALVTSKTSAERCKTLSLNTLQHNLDDKASLYRNDFLDSKIFYFAPPPKSGDVDTRLAHFLSQVTDAPKKIVLISTTGVYGNSHGELIDESTPINPQTGRAKRRASAEQQIERWAESYQRDYIILRVPGIYALGRLPLARLEKKLPVVQASEAAFTNRIHADDLADICIKAMQSSISGEIFNATDGTPSTMVEYFNQIADYSGLERPEQISLEEAKTILSEGLLSYALESRRIGNAKLLDMLDIKLKYPTLEATLNGER